MASFIETFEKIADQISPIADKFYDFIVEKWYLVLLGLAALLYVLVGGKFY